MSSKRKESEPDAADSAKRAKLAVNPFARAAFEATPAASALAAEPAVAFKRASFALPARSSDATLTRCALCAPFLGCRCSLFGLWLFGRWSITV